ncbi:MAG TPA: ArsA-related P-loop ATPase, partial [Actinomycetes bacterium]
GSYHRDVVRQMGETMHYRTPLMVLRDPDHTKVVLVTLPEPTPVIEARVLQDDLRRAGITPWAWVVNNSVAAARPQSPFLQQRAAAELEQMAEVENISPRVAIIPLLAAEPIGEVRLSELTNTSSHVA